MAVPKLRFKDDNRQDYPEWEENKLGDIGCVMRGLTYKPTDVRDDGIRVFRSSNVSEDTFIYGEDDVFVDVNAVNIPFVQNGDILITAANGSSRLVGKHSIIHGVLNDTAVHGGFMLLIRSKDSAFINSSMYSSWYKKFVYKFVAGGNGAIGNLKKSDLENVHLFVPCEKEKNKINDFLTTVEKRITAQQNIIADLEETKKGLLQKIFSQEIRFKDDNGQDYPEWEEKRLGDISYVMRGLTYKPTDVRDDGIRVFRSSNISEDTFIYGEDDVFVDVNAVNIPFVQNGDILITAANGSSRLVGKHSVIHGVLNDTAVHGGFMLLIRSKDSAFINSSMYSSWYKKFVYKFVAGGNGAIGNLKKSDLENVHLFVPCEKEKNKIDDFLSTFDKKITAEKQILSDLQEMKKGLLQQMFV